MKKRLRALGILLAAALFAGAPAAVRAGADKPGATGKSAAITQTFGSGPVASTIVEATPPGAGPPSR